MPYIKTKDREKFDDALPLFIIHSYAIAFFDSAEDQLLGRGHFVIDETDDDPNDGLN